MMVTRVWGLRERGDIDQMVQNFSYKMYKFWSPNVEQGDYS